MVSIDILPDDVLLAIFYSFLYDGQGEGSQNPWQLLVHVCQRWRTIVFGSPRHLNLQLFCTERTPVRDMLDVWPALPLITWCMSPAEKMDNIIAVLERTDRVSVINTDIWSSDWEIFLSATQRPFPELAALGFRLQDRTVKVVPDSFLGGSAPGLKHLQFIGIPFPGLPRLLLSATHLVTLSLWSIPHSGYFSPDAMVTVLATLTSLDSLILGFESPHSCPDPASRRPPPSTRSVIPVLTYFSFKGVSEYLEDLVACIDTPRLNHFCITFFNDVVFDTPQLIRLISHTPKSRALEKAHITFQDRGASLIFSSKTSGYWELHVIILCRGLDWQLSSLEQVCTSCSPVLSTLEDLYIYKCTRMKLGWKGKIENRLWLDLLRSFSAAKDLYLSEEFTPRIAPVLQELAKGRTTEVLPALQNIFLEGLDSSGPVEEGIVQFVSARQVAGHPIAISPWTNPDQDKE